MARPLAGRGAAPEALAAVSVKRTLLRSGSARPRLAKALRVSYGKALETVVGASGSFLERKPSQALRPAFLPIRLTNACIVSAEFSSLPPPWPKMPPTSEAIAITSVGFHGSICLPSSVYSPGFRCGSRLAAAM